MKMSAPNVLRDRIPRLGPDEAEPEVLDRGPREVEDLPRDEPEEHRRGERGRDGDPLEEDVSQPNAAAPEIGLRRRGGSYVVVVMATGRARRLLTGSS